MNKVSHLVNIRFFLSKTQFLQTFVFHFDEEVILKEGIYDGMFERLAGGIRFIQILNIACIECTLREMDHCRLVGVWSIV